MKKKESPSSASATKFAEALTKALQENTATRGVARAVATGSKADTAITQYRDIDDDLETLPLSS
jgi:hypothetical protein